MIKIPAYSLLERASISLSSNTSIYSELIDFSRRRLLRTINTRRREISQIIDQKSAKKPP